MRTFIALELSQESKESLGRVIEDVRPELGRLSWVKPENLHLTLKFLGEVAEERLEGIKDVLSRIAGEHSHFSYRIVGLGCFPNARRPRVLWAGMKGEIDKAEALYAAVDEKLGRLGFPREKRRFSLHITLARIKGFIRTERLSEVLKRNGSKLISEESGGIIALMKSELRPGGAVYTRLASFRLGKRAEGSVEAE